MSRQLELYVLRRILSKEVKINEKDQVLWHEQKRASDTFFTHQVTVGRGRSVNVKGTGPTPELVDSVSEIVSVAV